MYLGDIMHKYISKRTFIIINIILFIMEISLVYIIINSLLTKDILSPYKLSFYEYLKQTLLI